MTGAVGYQFADEPRPVIVVLKQKLTCDQQQELGRVMGENGFNGVFVGGRHAEFWWDAKFGRHARRAEGEGR